MDEKRYGWEAQARRTILSDEVELTTLPGFRVRARKFTVAASDEIRAAQFRKRDMIPARLRALMARAMAEGKETADLGADLTSDEAEELATGIPAEASSMADIMRLSILHGIGEHNLDVQDRRDQGMVPDLVGRIMEYPDTASELFRIVQDWNSPLPKATPAISGTSPNGSTEDVPSPPEKSFPTASAPPS